MASRILLFDRKEPIHVNVFLSTLGKDEFFSLVCRLVADGVVDPSRFTFEILEYENLSDYPGAIRHIDHLQQL